MTFEEYLDYGIDLYEIDCKSVLKVVDVTESTTMMALINLESLAAY